VPSYNSSAWTPKENTFLYCPRMRVIGPLPNNECPIAESVTPGLSTEPLPSNGHMRHNINEVSFYMQSLK
jgi:hypothetical protein